MKTPFRGQQTGQHSTDHKANEQLLNQRLEIKNIEKERMKRTMEERLTAKVDAIAQEWVEYDLRQEQMVLMKEARKERHLETQILKAAKAVQRETRDRKRDEM